MTAAQKQQALVLANELRSVLVRQGVKPDEVERIVGPIEEWATTDLGGRQ